MILVFGSINIDLIVPVPQLPRPGETVLGDDYRLLPGGKGANQALAARRAGAEVAFAGAVGTDAFAGLALAGLARDGVDTSLVKRVEAPTGCAAIIVSQAAENLIAVAPGANGKARSAQVPERMLDAKTLLVAQMEVPPAETADLVRRVRARGGRTLLNLAPATRLDPAVLADIDLLVANAAEAAALGTDPARLAPRLRQGIVVTRGAAGATAWLADGGRREVPALPVAAVDTTGAGDTFVGVLAAGLDQGLALEAALCRASAAASLACLAHGAQTAMPDLPAIEAAAARLR